MSLDPSQDPDRFLKPAVDPSALDPQADPDRYDPADGPRGQTLPELLGEGAYEEKRDNLQWLYGLLAVFGFLILVSLLLSHAFG